MRQLEIAFSETKEQIGNALLPIMKQFADYLLAVVVPNVQALAAGLTGIIALLLELPMQLKAHTNLVSN
jgi:hypothetical protein